MKGMGSPIPPEIAVALLRDALRGEGCYPSRFLELIFETAGELTAREGAAKKLVSSRLLAFAVGYCPYNSVPTLNQVDAIDARAIDLAQHMIRRDSERYKKCSGDYFESPAKAGTMERPGLSSSVDGLLKSLAKAASDEPDRDPVVTAADFLCAFPPTDGLAEGLLRDLGVGSGEFHRRMLEQIHSEDNDWVAAHRDEPAKDDELGRFGFAQVLADRIREARRAVGAQRPASFMVHLHGPWGSGKSSVLNFLERELTDEGGDWIVVTFNAWRDQRLQPPWWSLITAIYAGARSRLEAEKDEFARARLTWQWLLWRLRADFLPIAAALGCIAVIAMLVVFGIATNASATLTVMASAITLVGAIFLGSRSLALGSQRAAQTYADLKSDPYKPITSLFGGLIDTIGRPVVVFIDDLDRCEAKYVVDLLEGIQTLMRGASVTYVVAADRKWICSSFEQRYRDFATPVGEPGRPLGYLFLDKLFQISVAIPQLALDQRKAYWRTLLSDTGAGGSATAQEHYDADSARAVDDARAEVAQFDRQEQLHSYVRAVEVGGDRVRIRAVRTAAARRIASPEAARDAEHRLRDFASMIEPNPRAMKRLVNAYGMHQAAALLAGRPTDAGPLARWTILELRWPLLADFLALRPHCIGRIGDRLADGELPEVPAGVRELFGDEFVIDAAGHGRRDGLTAAAIRSILGARRER